MNCKAGVMKQKCPACKRMVIGLDATFKVCSECVADLDKDYNPTW